MPSCPRRSVVSWGILKSVAGRSEDVIISFCPGETISGVLCPFSVSQFKTDGELLVQQKATQQMMRGLEHFLHRKRLRDLGLFSLDKRRLRGGTLSTLINI